jgi:hypothetical protein
LEVIQLDEVMRMATGAILIKEERPELLSFCHVKTQGEGTHLQARKGNLYQDQFCQHFDLELSRLQTMRNKCV